MGNALVLRIATDATAASRGVSELAGNVVKDMSTISGSIGTVSQVAIPGMALATSVASASMGNSLLQLGLRFAQLRGAWILGGLAIAGALSGAREELERFSDILERAQTSNVSTTFFQAFTRSADEARVKTESLEKALLAVRPNITDRLGEPTQAREILETSFLPQKSTALDDFNNATDNEGRVRALTTAIKDLNQAYRETGNETLALSRNRVAELFGPEFADQIRRGTIEIDKFTANLDRLYAGGAGAKELVPAETLQRIKELDDRVGAVDRSIRDSLRPAFDDLAAAMLSGRAAGVAFYETLGGLISRAAELYNAAKIIGAAFASIPQRLVEPFTQNAGAGAFDTVYGPQGEILAQTPRGPQIAAGRTIQKIDDFGTITTELDPTDPLNQPNPSDAAENRRTLGLRNVAPPRPPPVPQPLADPRPRARPGPSPEAPDTTREDQIERYIATLEKEVRVVESEAATFSKSNAEKARANALARIGTEEVTPAQIKQIEALADRQTKAKETTESLRQAQEDYNNAVRLAGGAVSGFLSDIVSGGKNAEQALSNLIKRLADAVLQAQLLGDGPLAGLLGTKGKDGAVGGLIGQLFAGLKPGAGGGLFGAASDSLGFASSAARFAKGGIMGPGGPLSLRSYSTGGVAAGPQLALFGEGSTREAFVPLPDGRSIPVTLNLPDIGGLVGPSRGGNGGPPLVLVYNNAPQATISTRPDTSGNLTVFVEDAMAAAAARPGGVVQNAFANAFGLNPAAGIAR